MSERAPKPGDVLYFSAGHWDMDEKRETLEELRHELAGVVVERDSTLYVTQLSDKIRNDPKYGQHQAPLTEYNPEDFKRTLAEVLQARAQDEEEFAEKSLGYARWLRDMAVEARKRGL